MQKNKLRRITINIALCIGSMLIFLLICEGAIRAFHAFYRQRNIELDEKYGWLPPEHISYKTTKTASDGSTYPVQFSTQNHGFRMWGNPNTSKPKIFVVGDSFTHALDASDHQTYYARLEQELDAEVFAFGCINYSNLQEFMILDDYLDTIQPDLIVWQFCSNDIVNNTYELEKQSYQNNSGLRRPYLTLEEEVIYRTPTVLPGVRNFANQYSKFLYFVFNRLDRLFARLGGQESGLEVDIVEQGQEHKGFQLGVEITYRILKQAQEQLKDIPVVAFSVDDVPPFYVAFIALAQNVKFDFVSGIPQAIRQANDEGELVFADDAAHWTPKGHEICSNLLVEYFQERSLLASSSQN